VVVFPLPDTTMSGDFVYHEKAIIDDGVTILLGTRVWAFAHLQAGSEVGAGCNIGEGLFIEKGAVVGNNVTIKNSVQIWNGVLLENDVFVTMTLHPHHLDSGLRFCSPGEGGVELEPCDAWSYVVK
jgi:NDP-sugar pyrophosphorylase family protein